VLTDWWSGSMLEKHEALSSNPNTIKKLSIKGAYNKGLSVIVLQQYLTKNKLSKGCLQKNK
jgi:hypothetical protein